MCPKGFIGYRDTSLTTTYSTTSYLDVSRAGCSELAGASGRAIDHGLYPRSFRVRKACQKRRLAASSSSAGTIAGRVRPAVPLVQENQMLVSASENVCLASG